jgi:outer membrane protein assembly factor BamB
MHRGFEIDHHSARASTFGFVLVALWSTQVSLAETASETARKILAASGVKGGIVVHLGCGDGKLTAALRANDSYMVQGLGTDAGEVRRAREHVKSLGVYGKVSVDLLRSKGLPYIDNLVNLVVSDDLGEVPMSEVTRALCPGGVAYIRQNGNWTKTVKPRPGEIDEWTHYLHDADNNAVAHDSVVGPPRHQQWVGSPKWTRHHDNMTSISAVVSSGGRLFYIFDEGSGWSLMAPSKWALIARDAFNGTILWKRSIGQWHTRFWPLKSGPSNLPRRLIAAGDTVFATLGIDAPVTAMDAATGETMRIFEDTKGTEELILSDDVLFVLINSSPVKLTGKTISETRRRARQAWWDESPKKVMAIQASTGKALWQKESPAMSLTLAADSQRVFFHDGNKVVCLDRKKGTELWSSDPVPRMSSILSFFAPTLVVYKDVVLFSGGSPKKNTNAGGDNRMTALSAVTGKTLWSADHPSSGYKSPEDILVAGGLVWFGATTSGGLNGVLRGRDPMTGTVKSEFPPDVDTYWFHHRCHRGKATDRYLLMSRTGIEFVDHSAKHWDINHWVRGACLYGVLPCNGLVYAPPHPCICYPEAKLNGFNALAADSATRRIPAQISENDRLVRGPAYTEVSDQKAEANADDWPTYRHDIGRSGSTPASVPSDLEPEWQTDLGAKLSSVVVADGRLFVAAIHSHTVHALDAETGKPMWAYTVGGRVDSPPTAYKGLVLFGSADGHVYCLRASDGQLAWRFRAAPVDRRLSAFEQIESVWPVHGSVLVRDDIVYCVAGRSMFLDGGLRLLQLDPMTGRKLSETILDERDPETGKNLQTHIKWLNMPVALPDVLSADSRYIYMRSQRFDTEGSRLRLAPVSADRMELGSDQVGEGPHLFCPTGFLDDSGFHRSYWMYGRTFSGGWNGYFVSGKFAPSGRLLVFDEKDVYGFGRKPKYYRWTTPLEHQLFAAGKEPTVTERIGRKPKGSRVSVANSKSLDPSNTPLSVLAWVKSDKPNGVVVARGGPYQGYALVLRNGRPKFVIRADKEISSVIAKRKVAGKWTHLAGVLDSDKKLHIYVNGKLSASSQALKLIPSSPAQAMEIGADEGGPVGDYQSPFGFTGTIDEVGVYHRALTAEEVAAHYSSPGKGLAQGPGPAARFSFDGDSSTDESGNKNHGKAEGASPVAGKFGKALKFTGASSVVSFKVVHHWTADVPFFVRAMVLTGGEKRVLFIAGPPEVVKEEEAYRSFTDSEIQEKVAGQDQALRGEKGALLWAVSPADGKKLAEYKLESPPAWDGMIAAGGRLYLSTAGGKVLCFAGK